MAKDEHIPINQRYKLEDLLAYVMNPSAPEMAEVKAHLDSHTNDRLITEGLKGLVNSGMAQEEIVAYMQTTKERLKAKVFGGFESSTKVGEKTKFGQHYIDALRDNNPKLIKEVYKDFSGKIVSMILKNNGTEDDARDIIQEALITIYWQAKTKALILTCPFEAYLYLICKRKWINELNKRSRSGVTFKDLEGFEYIEAAQKLYEETEIEQKRDTLFRRHFRRLGKRCQEILQWSWSGLNMKEVATKLSMGHNAARQKKFKCIKLLMKWIHADPEFSDLHY